MCTANQPAGAAHKAVGCGTVLMPNTCNSFPLYLRSTGDPIGGHKTFSSGTLCNLESSFHQTNLIAHYDSFVIF